MDYQEFEKYCDNDLEVTHEAYAELNKQKIEETRKKRMKTAGLLAIGISAAYLYGKRKGFDKGLDIGFDKGFEVGFDLGDGVGELHGFKDAVKSITDGAVDLYNLGGLEE